MYSIVKSKSASVPIALILLHQEKLYIGYRFTTCGMTAAAHKLVSAVQYTVIPQD